MKLFKKKILFDEDTLRLYDNLSLVCGIFSVVLALAGIFGIIIGFIGICLSVTYYTATKKVRVGYILSIIGSIFSAISLVLQLCLVYGIHLN